MASNQDASGNPIEGQPQPQVLESTALMAINASEINQQIATAKQFPRDLAIYRRQANAMITLDAESAASCIYALPRAGAIIKGPTARFAEVIASAWRNNRYGARVIAQDDEFITAQGMFLDLENNVAVSFEVRRRIVDSKGRRYSPDMIAVTATAACSIALRNAVLKGVPKAAWKGLYASAERVLMGNAETLVDSRQKLVEQFRAFGMTVPMLAKVLGVSGLAEISAEHLVTLQGILTALRDGDTTVESLMASDTVGQAEQVKAKGERTIENIKGQYRKDSGVMAPSPEVQQAQSKLEQRRGRAHVAPANERAAPAPAAVEENMDAEPVEDAPQRKLGGSGGEEGW